MILDEHEVPWQVGAHDPANPSVLALKRLGYTYLVLPRSVLTTGAVRGTIVLPDNRVAALRLRECLQALGAECDILPSP